MRAERQRDEIQATALVPAPDRGGEIGALIAAGGMGEVYRALDTRPGCEVALEMVPPAASSRRREDAAGRDAGERGQPCRAAQ